MKLVEYLDAIRDVERRIARAEEQSGRELPVVDHPAGVPDSFDDHVKLMCDLQVLAYQADLTRVVTFMLGREFSGVTYPQIGVPDAHHPITHHQQEPEKIVKVAKINAYQVTKFAYLLDRMRARRTATARCSITRRCCMAPAWATATRTTRATSRCSSPAGEPGISRADATSGSRRRRRWRTCT